MPTAWSPERIPEVSGSGGFSSAFNMLWVTQTAIDRQVYGYSALQVVNPDSPPAVILTLPDPEPGASNPVNVNAVGFASNGDMWVGYAEQDSQNVTSGRMVSKVSANKLAVGGLITPDFSFRLDASSVPSTASVGAIALHPNGDLWVSSIALTNRSAGIFCYSAASIANPGSPLPTVTLAQPFPPVPDNAQHTNSANDLCFDSIGNLWFCNAIAGTLNKLSVAQLLSNNTTIFPDVILSAAVSYTGLRFDSAGNLWCARSSSAGAAAVDMFAAADITVSGPVSPARTILGPRTKARFDGNRNMWSFVGNAIAAYSPQDIAASGAPSPRVLMTGGNLTAIRMFSFAP